jgi:choline-sulfatase
MFMIRHQRWKYIYYPGFLPQLFDFLEDPFEKNDLAEDPNFSAVLAECHQELEKIVDPDKANSLAFSDQAERIKELGGADAILASEDFDYSPVPLP